MNLVLVSAALNSVVIGLLSDFSLGVNIAWALGISLLIYAAYRKGFSEGRARKQ